MSEAKSRLLGIKFKNPQPIRLLDVGKVSALRSQTIYHALAYAMTPETPDTVAWSHPQSRYACVGFHQDASQELDLDFCARNGIPVFRRETGGGAVLVDDGQLFVQWIFQPASLPRKVDARYRLFIGPLAETFGHFGIPAHFHPPNDIHAGGRKITGTGAATIGNAEVVTGNFLLDFDCGRMAQILNAPNEAFRELFRQSLEKYMTSMKRELGEAPDADEIKQVYFEKCARALGRNLQPGSFSAEELAWIDRLDEKFSDPAWLLESRKPPAPTRMVKVHAGVWVGWTNWQAAGGKFSVALRTQGNRIDHVSFDGGFEFQPAAKLRGLEMALRNVALEEECLREVLDAFYELHKISSPGVTTDDWLGAILQIMELKR